MIYEVGLYKIKVEAGSLAESSVFGPLTIIGFSHFLRKVFGRNFFEAGLTWNKLDKVTQEKICDLLGKLFYVHILILSFMCNLYEY